jgi:hypothetical protein
MGVGPRSRRPSTVLPLLLGSPDGPRCRGKPPSPGTATGTRRRSDRRARAGRIGHARWPSVGPQRSRRGRVGDPPGVRRALPGDVAAVRDECPDHHDVRGDHGPTIVVHVRWSGVGVGGRSWLSATSVGRVVLSGLWLVGRTRAVRSDAPAPSGTGLMVVAGGSPGRFSMYGTGVRSLSCGRRSNPSRGVRPVSPTRASGGRTCPRRRRSPSSRTPCGRGSVYPVVSDRTEDGWT